MGVNLVYWLINSDLQSLLDSNSSSVALEIQVHILLILHNCKLAWAPERMIGVGILLQKDWVLHLSGQVSTT